MVNNLICPAISWQRTWDGGGVGPLDSHDMTQQISLRGASSELLLCPRRQWLDSFCQPHPPLGSTMIHTWHIYCTCIYHQKTR